MTGAPLDGLRVLDFSELLPGPFLTQSLVELGAEVIKIERPGTGDAGRHLSPQVFAAINRGKTSRAIDLKTDAGRQDALALVEGADVLVESYRPGVMARLGLGPEAVCAANARLVYLSLSGFGATGPAALRSGHDIDFLAQSGLAALMGGGRSQVPVGDLGGALYGLSAVLAALVQRSVTGQGQWIDLSLTDCMQHWTNTRRPQPPEGHAALPPGYGIFACRDGQIALSALEDGAWRQFAAALDLPGGDWPLARRRENAAALNAGIRAALAPRTCRDAIAMLEAAGIAATPVLSPDEAAIRPQALARDLVQQTRAGPLVRFPVRLRGMADTPTDAPDLPRLAVATE